MNNITAVILAAGMGPRMKSKTPKVLHKICNRELVKYVIESAKCGGCDKIVTVIGHCADAVKEVLGDSTLFAVQSEQKGTGHACMQAISEMDGEYTFVFNGDKPLLTSETVKAVIDCHKKSGNSVTVITAILDDATGYGRIIRDDSGNVVGIVEHNDADEDQLLINEINSGMYVFNTTELKAALEKLASNNAQGEYYLTDTLSIILANGKKIGGFTVSDTDEILGINDRIQLSVAEKIMQKRINEKHMLNGVTIHSPETVIISPDCEIGEDTEIFPDVVIENGCKIASDVVITSASKLSGATIGNGVSVQSSVVLKSTVGDGTTVGPFAYIRPDCVIGKNARIGDFVELKNCNIGDGTKVSHLTYVGDADVGSGCNFGCGTVTVNYDGKKKYRTVIGNDVFIGCNSNLVAPVVLKDGAYTAAGSTITDEVPENNLAIARARQVNKSMWKDRRSK